MKEKRYFCDWFEKINNSSSPKFIITYFALIIIACTVTYGVFRNMYKQEVAAYSNKDYEYLQEIATSICDKDNQSLNLANVPDNVTISNTTLEKDMITFKCYLDRDFWFVDNPYVNVKVTDNFNDIQITHVSKEEATSSATLVFLSIISGLLVILMPTILIYFFMLAASIISYSKKQEDIRNKHYTFSDKAFDEHWNKLHEK